MQENGAIPVIITAFEDWTNICEPLLTKLKGDKSIQYELE